MALAETVLQTDINIISIEEAQESLSEVSCQPAALLLIGRQYYYSRFPTSRFFIRYAIRHQLPKTSGNISVGSTGRSR